MIDWILEMIGAIILWLHILAIIAIIFKTILVFQNKGFNLPAVFSSFFRIYSHSDRAMTESVGRRRFMKWNNLVNYYIYTWIILTVIVLVVFERLY